MDSKQLENWADKLILEYEKSKRGLYSMKRNLGNSEMDNLDKSQINSMISDMTFAIDWMKTGRRPGNRRGIDRRSVYQRTILVDMELMPSVDLQPKQKELNEDEKRAILSILIDLSHRERQCYLLHMAQGYSMSEIEKELGIKKPTVQKYIERAKAKINRKISCHTSVI